jgi:hypothetical protein
MGNAKAQSGFRNGIHSHKLTEILQDRRSKHNQLASGSAVLATVRDLNERWSKPGGVAVRLLECSLQCMTRMHGEKAYGLKMSRRGGVLRYSISESECVEEELARKLKPASLLRWDLPNAIFNGGRCVSPAWYERSRFPDASKMTPDGYLVKGFLGHNVSATGVGWVFGDIAQHKRGGAFGHDAWTSNYLISGTKHSSKEGVKLEGAGKHSMDRCDYARVHSSGDYAAARLTAREMHFDRFPSGTPPHRAAAYKWGFANSSWNCYHGADDWEGAFSDQRAYAVRIAERSEALPGGCSIWGSLYNQIHLSWNTSDLKAIFFVNDTLTANLSAADGAEKPLSLLRHAISMSHRAYGNALITQRTMLNRTGVLLPVVQMRTTSECFDARPLKKRLDDAKADVNMHPHAVQVFEAPMGALREASTLLELKGGKSSIAKASSNTASKKKKKKKKKSVCC